MQPVRRKPLEAIARRASNNGFAKREERSLPDSYRIDHLAIEAPTAN
jgi:hypothetical protein